MSELSVFVQPIREVGENRPWISAGRLTIEIPRSIRLVDGEGNEVVYEIARTKIPDLLKEGGHHEKFCACSSVVCDGYSNLC